MKDDINWDTLDVCTSNLPSFMKAIETQRSRLSDEEWKTFISTQKKLREWQFFLLNDPYTRWGYLKPRGYAGDALLMDFAYKHPSISGIVERSSEDGKHIYNYTSNADQSLSAVSRIKFIAELIENKATSKINIASIASGHGREYEHLSPNAISNVSSLLTVDSDSISTEELISSKKSIPVTAIKKNIFRTRLEEYGSMDIVYSLGLFDYLNDESAIKVLENMCSCVSENGTVVIANLHHRAGNLGYCEAIMDWWMIPRNEEDLSLLASKIRNFPGSFKTQVETIDCFSYLILSKNA